MKPFQRLFLSAIFCWLAAGMYANDLTITGLTVTQNATTGGTIAFTISWNNCWNLSGSTAPNNWDAAWVMVKWRNCASSQAVPFTQGTLGTFSQHIFPGTLQPMTSYPSSGYLTGGGSVPITSGALDDVNGVMLSPTTSGTQTNVSGTVTLYVTNLPDNTNTITADVIGIEMVYVPQGPFNLGDGSTNGSDYHFCTSASSASPTTIGSAYETGASNFYYMSSGYNSPATYATGVPAAFPKGYYGFYCMKYEISEDLYTTFLNTIGSSAAQNRWIGNYTTDRQQVSQTNSYTFSDARPYRAQNYLSYADWMALLDWACLRPLSELEFEKACRGGSSTTANGAMNDEYPWQSTVITGGTTFSGPENGTETMTGGANCAAGDGGNAAYIGGDGGSGPVRSGIFATATTGQQSAGSTYFGIMEMGGNVREYVICLSNTIATDTFTRNVGDGVLVTVPGTNGAGTVTGDVLQPTWPYPELTNPGSNTWGAIGQRGGDWYSGGTASGQYTNYLAMNGNYDPIQTSAREMCLSNASYYSQIYFPFFSGSGRFAWTGGRGGR
jgi:formylglycine-generating enzyme required for sulfatase activity